MSRASLAVDNVRASRDGHEFHEAWTARKAMQLLLPGGDLVGIAVEGLEPSDQANASTETVEVADLTLYYGRNSTFKGATKIQIAQFKYSISKKNTDFRAADAKKTITKFAAAYTDCIKSYGAKAVHDRLKFELITNRPIFHAFKMAIQGIANGTALPGEAGSQARQFKTASGLDGASLQGFARRFMMTGSSESLADAKKGLSRMLVDWSAASDALAAGRLGDLRQMVREKAGSAGQSKNVIRRTDIIAALRIGDADDLLPCPAGLADVGKIVEREQLKDALALIPHLRQPLLVHSAGGVGKTVFMESLAEALKDEHEIVFFDCFGGGAYRSPEDARHLPKRGLIHIANTLAVNGLCDPILPDSGDIEALLRTFRRRLKQCIGALSAASRAKGLLLFIDAIDNAAEQARDRGEPSYPTLLVQSLHAEPVPGVKLILSSRSHRIPIAGYAHCDFKLKPFTSAETEAYLRSRLPDVKDLEIRVAHARSGGNARILEYLLESERGLLDRSEIDNRIELGDLIRARLDRALALAVEHGYRPEDTDAFLAGLAVLPPPVPLDEYAQAHGMPLSAIESFTSDLWPLLERTRHGLMFRDEPTETLVREKYASCADVLRRVAGNLLARQDRSVYAARALPGLLQKIGDGSQLFNLAFDTRLPAAITSTVGKRNIRHARLKAAVRHAAGEQDYDRLVHLLVELSTITAVEQRGADYILRSPDLVIAAKDIDATRRLFETPTAWQGTRHARLCIANVLSGDPDEASRHAIWTDEWLRHHWQRDRSDSFNEPGPERLDVASIPFFLCTQRRFREAAEFMGHWAEWYAYEVQGYVLGLLRQAETVLLAPVTDAYLDSIPIGISGPAAALSFLELEETRAKELVDKLSKACRRHAKIEFHESYSRETADDLGHGIRKAAAIALRLNAHANAIAISRLAPHERPSIWAFRDHSSDQHLFPFLFHTALTAAAKRTDVYAKDLMPKDLAHLVKGIKTDLEGTAFLSKIRDRLGKHPRPKEKQSDTKSVSLTYEQTREAERFLDERLEPLLLLTRSLTALLGAPACEADAPFHALLDAWAKTGSRRERYGTEELSPFFQALGRQMATFALACRRDLTSPTIKEFLKLLHEQRFIGPSSFIDTVAILARRTSLEDLAGEEAVKAKRFIDGESDVTHRSHLYAALARAISPAGFAEAAAYFRMGLEQMDAIGSGDYEFTNELLIFASSLNGKELEENRFHTLTNICELNLPDEAEKFPWFAFGKALSRAAGCRGLAKLGRWDDRGKAPLEYTLLPCLTALLEDDKIAVEDALALNRLAEPAEFFGCNTATLAEVINSKRQPDVQALVTELIEQFKDNNNGVPSGSSVETLATLAGQCLGKGSEATLYLSTAHSHFSAARDLLNENMNYRGKLDPRPPRPTRTAIRQDEARRQSIVDAADPCDENSLARAVEDFERSDHAYGSRKGFFAGIRAKVPFAKRVEYVRIISALENLNIHLKLDELRSCNEAWGASTAALKDAFAAAGIPMITLHADEMVSYGRLSGHILKELSDLSSLPIPAIALELVKLYAERQPLVPASVWLGLAAFACGEAQEGEGQAALARLLDSDAAKLSSTVTDGPWKPALYPENETTATFSGLVWRMLGSPAAAGRWRAAHSIRCFAKFERWNVIDALVRRLERKKLTPVSGPRASLLFYARQAMAPDRLSTSRAR